MLSPIESLAFTMQSNPGTYALLLGSGISRAAGLPTGHEIKLDLIRKLAALRHENPEPDPEAWYIRSFRAEPNYSDLLDALTNTGLERQQLLRPFFEPNEEDLQDGLKIPTAAHQAIASLVKQGFVKVIVTTNFDDLMEKALEEQGIAPTVVGTNTDLGQALPLVHAQCYLVEVNGSYRRGRLLNTPAELETYEPQMTALLDEIFRDFGLLVCGWSADWDVALRRALGKAKNQRFSVHWTTRGDASENTRQLLEKLQAAEIPIRDADNFFRTLLEDIEVLEERNRSHPLQSGIAVGRLKRYLLEPSDRIRLADLVDEVVQQALEALREHISENQQGTDDVAVLPDTLRIGKTACSTLLEMGLIAGYYAELRHLDVWQRALIRLAIRPAARRNNVRFGFPGLPATMLFYSLGLGATAADRLKFLGQMFATSVRREHGGDSVAIEHLPPGNLIDNIVNVNLYRWLHDELREYAKTLIPDDGQYSFEFDKLAVLIAVSDLHHSARRGSPPLGFSSEHTDNPSEILQDIEDSISEYGESSPFVTSGIAGLTASSWSEAIDRMRQVLTQSGL